MPIARFCLRRSVRFQDFSDLAKRAFVQAAREEMDQLEIPHSAVRMSVMTGLQRRDLTKLLSEGKVERVLQNPIARVIGQWSIDRRFLDQRGKPRGLESEGKQSQFAKLVRTVSKDLNPYAVLFELDRLGFIEKQDGFVKLLARAYEPGGDIREGFSMLANDTNDLIRAVEENVLGDVSPANLHSKTEFDNIDPAEVPQLRMWFLKIGEKLHREVRQHLSKFDRDINPRQKEGGVRVVFGSFSHIEPERPGENSMNLPKKGKGK